MGRTLSPIPDLDDFEDEILDLELMLEWVNFEECQDVMNAFCMWKGHGFRGQKVGGLNHALRKLCSSPNSQCS